MRFLTGIFLAVLVCLSAAAWAQPAQQTPDQSQEDRNKAQ